MEQLAFYFHGQHPEKRPERQNAHSKLFERVAEYGVGVLSASEILAALTGLGIRKATKVLEAVGGIEGLAKNEIWDMLAVPYLGKVRTLRLVAAIELATRLQQAKVGERPIIKSPEDAAGLLMEKMRHLDREHFVAMHLNTKNHVLGIETVTIGSLNSSIIHPRELFKQAIKRSAAAIILVHNHPSGSPIPSPEDLAVTKRLVEAGQLLGVKVLDHIIIGDNEFYSLKQKGAM